MEFILYRVVYVANESKKKNEREKGGRNTQGKLLASGSWMTTLIQPSCVTDLRHDAGEIVVAR